MPLPFTGLFKTVKVAGRFDSTTVTHPIGQQTYPALDDGWSRWCRDYLPVFAYRSATTFASCSRCCYIWHLRVVMVFRFSVNVDVDGAVPAANGCRVYDLNAGDRKYSAMK